MLLYKYIMILLRRLLHDLYRLIMSFLFQQVTSTLILVSLFDPNQLIQINHI
jgi:hypothetical protein